MFAIESLSLAGEHHANSASVRLACAFLLSKQEPDGGWGESYKSCETEEYVHNDRSQVVNTAWAVLTLITARYPDKEPIRRGCRLIMERQLKDGSWAQESIEGVFNKVSLAFRGSRQGNANAMPPLPTTERGDLVPQLCKPGDRCVAAREPRRLTFPSTVCRSLRGRSTRSGRRGSTLARRGGERGGCRAVQCFSARSTDNVMQFGLYTISQVHDVCESRCRSTMPSSQTWRHRLGASSRPTRSTLPRLTASLSKNAPSLPSISFVIFPCHRDMSSSCASTSKPRLGLREHEGRAGSREPDEINPARR